MAREGPISTHAAQNSTLFRVGGGGVASFTYVTGKDPTLLTSSVGVGDKCNHHTSFNDVIQKTLKNTCCGSILSLVQILFSFVSNSLSCITIPKNKGK